MANLYIPKKIKVGFQERQGTFTGKLAYIIYFDDKDVLRKEKSWQSWRDSNIEPIEFENTPRNGYLFNKGIKRDGYYWGSGRSVIRVYDPRDFEFEVTVDNLIGILMHSDVSKRDIVEECIFAWEGTELVLLPINSEIYQASLNFTKKQGENLSAKTLVKGYTYNQKKTEEVLTYIGYYKWYDWKYDSGYYNKTHKSMGKKHIFYNGEHYITPAIQTFSSVNNEEIAENYSTLVENFFKTMHSQPIVSFKIAPTPIKKYEEKLHNNYRAIHLYKEEDGLVKTYNLQYRDDEYWKKHNSVFSDSNETETRFVFEDKSMSQIHTQNPYSYWQNNNKGPLHKTLIAKAVALGYQPENIKFEECVVVLESEQFTHGDFVFVLENGTECLYYI